MYHGIAEGIRILFTFHNLGYLCAGILIGILLGAIPGFNPSTAMVVLLPFTYILSKATSIIFLCGIAGASIYGGSITAILFCTPGTIGSIVTTLDGYEMTKKGQGVQALGISGAASSVGGIVSGISLLLFAPPLALLATKFSFPEMFVVILWAFTIIGAVKGKLLKALASGALGMLMTGIGADPLMAYPRMTFGFPQLFDGIDVITAIMGCFCFSQMLRISQQEFILEDVGGYQGGYRDALKGIVFTFRHPVILLRASVIGVILGALPGAGAANANLISYGLQKSIAKDSEEYGTGKPEGVLAAEGANNATEASCLIPTLTLGIPGSNIAAIFLAAFMLHGVLIGPRVFITNGPVVYGLIFAFILSNPIMFGISFLISKPLGKITTFPVQNLLPYMLVFILFGTFAIENSSFNLYIMVIFGVIAYFLESYDYSVMAFVLPFVLGKDLERSFLLSMKYSGNNPIIFFKSTICIIIWILILLTITIPAILRMRGRGKSELEKSR